MTFDTRPYEDSTFSAELPGDTAAHRPLPVLVIMHGEASSAGRIGQALINRGHALDIRKPRYGCALPQSLARHAGVVVFGGPMSCNDPDDYLKDEIDFVGVALREQKPFLGICLGAQMLAKHLGAPVAQHPASQVEIGYFPLRPTPAGRALGPWPEHVYHWHREGFQVPAGATHLAQGDSFENQAFSYGPAALGVQFHPEITYTLVNRWTVMAKDWQDRPGAQERSAQLAGHLLHGRTVGGWLDRTMDRWLAGRVHAAV
jgi:GMP synthase (glutamine-hydrolysing)